MGVELNVLRHAVHAKREAMLSTRSWGTQQLTKHGSEPDMQPMTTLLGADGASSPLTAIVFDAASILHSCSDDT
jgi:hypothetical protein